MANHQHGCGFLFLVFGSSLGIWLQWKKHQAMWNAIDREIHQFKDFLGIQWSDGSEFDDLESPIDNPFSWEPDEN